MKSKSFLIILLLLFSNTLFISCKKENPKLTIPEEKLIQIFFDIHSAEYIVNRASSDDKDSLTNVYMNQIFTIYKIDKIEFEKNLKLLQDNPDYFKKFYEKLDDYGEKMMDEQKEKTKDKKDMTKAIQE